MSWLPDLFATSWILRLGFTALWLTLGLLMGSIWSRQYVKSRGGYPRYPDGDYYKQKFDRETRENAIIMVICSVLFCPVVLLGFMVTGFFYGCYQIVTKVALPPELR